MKHFLGAKDIVKETPLQLDHCLSQSMIVSLFKTEDLQWVRSFF